MQPYLLGLTGMLPPTDRRQVQLRIAYSWPAQHMETDVDGVLWVTCHAGQGTLITSAKTPTEDGVRGEWVARPHRQWIKVAIDRA